MDITPCDVEDICGQQNVIRYTDFCILISKLRAIFMGEVKTIAQNSIKTRLGLK